MFKTLIRIYRWVFSLSFMFVVGTFCLILVLLSFGLLRNFCVKYIFKYAARSVLMFFGYSYILPHIDSFPKKQVMYTINHNSYLDIYLLASVGLPNIRYILSEVTLKFIPLVMTAKAIGTWYIPQKFRPNRRLKFFLKTTGLLKRTNYSVIASAEGVRKYTHGIMPFNKGIFHMAMEAGIPIVPLFIYIPKEMNPFKGQYSEAGEIQLHILDEIDNSNWKLETIWDDIAKVRKVYVDHFNKLNHTDIQ